MTASIFHVTTADAWKKAQADGSYRSDTLEGQGFIHCSKVDQVLRVANSFYAGRHGLVILVISPQTLVSELRWEPGTDLASQLFPHVYGPINLDAVHAVVEFEPSADGSFTLPPILTQADS